MKKIKHTSFINKRLVKNVAIHFDYEGDLVFRCSGTEIVWFRKHYKDIRFWGPKKYEKN